MTIDELDRRFGEILRRIEALEIKINGVSGPQRPRALATVPYTGGC